ncbi:MAG: 30S ribosomal protein S6 [Candidatus Eisenbacteria bacterium]|uniref:Small ribosomal subunit protein bS6 n=1 Tax=Eiseniibacteriota bacterium TaxID=2212470 RepID=A0A7Y2E6X4_UNCEI|nr:30S ribosomal protein S6 [Candidatus Eisenbacteria bacterium]
MREYESIFILNPEVEDAQVDTEVGKIKDIVTGGSGEITEVQKWGRRKLAYEIQKKKEGIYTLVRFMGDTEVLGELNRRYRLNEDLLRHLTVVYEGPSASELEAMAQAEAEAQAAEGSEGAPAAEASPAPEAAPAPAPEAPAPVAEAPAPETTPTAEASEDAPEKPSE